MPFAVLPPAPPPVAVASTARLSRAETAIVTQINRVRRARGLHALRTDAPLAGVARAHSAGMLAHNVLTHGSFDGSSFSARLRRAGQRRHYGETLAWTPVGTSPSAPAVIRLWLNSPSHRAVVLDGSLRRIGVSRLFGTLGPQRGFAITADYST
jgi:uncharacterized protein YkwD